MLTISIISHGQGHLVHEVLADLSQFYGVINFHVILTINIPEALPFKAEDFLFPLKIVENQFPKGFGANHNSAFMLSSGDFFCILNPDIRMTMNPFPGLVHLALGNNIGVVAPVVVNTYGQREDSARRFPSPWELIRKVFGGKSAIWSEPGPVSHPDWIAGMFMLFQRHIFKKLHGFDERYFLYYEDVDLCARLRLAGYKCAINHDVAIVHNARRSSHNRLRYALMHVSSIVRFFTSGVYWRLQTRRILT